MHSVDDAVSSMTPSRYAVLEVPLNRATDPTHVDNPSSASSRFRPRVAKLEDAVGILEDLVFDVDDDAEETKPTWTLNRGKRIPLSLHSTWCVPTPRTPIAFSKNGELSGWPRIQSTGRTSAWRSSIRGRSGRDSGGMTPPDGC